LDTANGRLKLAWACADGATKHAQGRRLHPNENSVDVARLKPVCPAQRQRAFDALVVGGAEGIGFEIFLGKKGLAQVSSEQFGESAAGGVLGKEAIGSQQGVVHRRPGPKRLSLTETGRQRLAELRRIHQR
jgi:hypothetical protein